MGVIPDLPSVKAVQVAGLLQPRGVTQPRPVTATLCLVI